MTVSYEDKGPPFRVEGVTSSQNTLRCQVSISTVTASVPAALVCQELGFRLSRETGAGEVES